MISVLQSQQAMLKTQQRLSIQKLFNLPNHEAIYNINMDNKNTQKDRIRGSLVGGAVGDALGYPVEFMTSYAALQSRYGERGIIRYELDNNGTALISDDTQMTLFTACGLLNGKAQGKEYKYAICYAYTEWLRTQMGNKKVKNPECWIYNLKEMHSLRAPGNTCISALSTIVVGREPMNSSKGCGGIMRTAPVALFGAVDGRIGIEDAMVLAADAAEITHQHPLGWLPSALEAYIIYRFLQNESPTVDDFKAYMAEGYQVMERLFTSVMDSINELHALTDHALSLINNDRPDVENIDTIGEGWVGDEAFAIAIYCSAKYFDDFEQAMIASVNHKGDSDSTGAVTGNILGAIVGYDAIPQYYKDNLELHDVILHVADDLWRGVSTEFKIYNTRL